jgi:hypothetical protein
MLSVDFVDVHGFLCQNISDLDQISLKKNKSHTPPTEKFLNMTMRLPDHKIVFRGKKINHTPRYGIYEERGSFLLCRTLLRRNAPTLYPIQIRGNPQKIYERVGFGIVRRVRFV